MVKKVFNIIEWIVLLVAGVITLLFIIINLLGFDYYSVISQSMGEEIPMGSFVVASSCTAETAKETITSTPLDEKLVLVCQDENMSIPVMHQVIGYDDTTVTIHGVANKDGVNEVFAYEDVIGIVVFSIPLLGYLIQWISNIYFWIIVVIIIIGYLIIKQIVVELTTKQNN